MGLATLLMIPAEWLDWSYTAMAAEICLIGYMFWALPNVPWSRWVFVAIAVGLTITAAITRDDFDELLISASRAGVFIAAFFIAQATLRHAAMSSEAIARCGRHLASQPPGRRYLALTSGGHLFGLMLSYGSISLLGGMSTVNASGEADERIRELRIKRMLLATQRGFISTLAWSPLAFSFAVSTSIIEGSSWGGAVSYGIVSALIIAGLGWFVDHLIKPTARSAAKREIVGSAYDLLPLALLLSIILGTVGLLQWLSGVRIVGVVLLTVPLISIVWIMLQGGSNNYLKQWQKSGTSFIDEMIPSYRSEIVLLSMAAFIGTMGSALLVPILGASGHDFEMIPGWLVLVLIVWFVPLSGLFGMNPVLSVSLMAPLLPAAELLNVDPNILVVAITAGWALGGAVSPFTATTLIVGMLGKVSAWRVGIGWNGLYTILAGTLLSIWVVLAAQIHGMSG